MLRRFVPAPAVLAVLAALFAFARPASAYDVDQDAAHFHVTLDAPGAATCVVLPASARERDPAACEGIDPAALAAGLQGTSKDSAVAFALLRFETWAVVTFVGRVSEPGATAISAEDLKAFGEGTRKGILRTISNGATLDTLDEPSLFDARSVSGVHMHATFNSQDGPMDLLFDTIPAKDSVYYIAVMGEASHARDLGPIRTRILESARADAPAPAESRAERIGYAVGKLTGFALMLGVGIFFVLRARARRARMPPPMPPPWVPRP